ncbi:MAG: hypothetical protein HKL95_06625 [Phycisphaerae bacterium]|nr:hypothetical protein [Phycisphaerae bacterium]
MLDNGQACGFYVTIAREVRRTPQAATVYYSRMFFDENYPFGETAQKSSYFREQGEVRCLQHHNTALVCYNPVPVTGVFRRLRTGIFRPLKFSRPREVYVGSTYVGHLNYLGDAMQPIAIDEGSVYVGIIPLRLTSHDCVREAHLHLHTYADHLAILMYSGENWEAEDSSCEQGSSG